MKTKRTDSKKYLIVYHDECTDGFSAYWVIAKFFDSIGADYIGLPVKAGRPFPESFDLSNIGAVVMVDTCFEEEDITRISGKVDHVLILDHHKTAIDYWKKQDTKKFTNVDFVFSDNLSGVALAWDYFPSDYKPWFIDYISDHDLFTHKLPNSREVSAFIQSRPRTLEEFDRLSLMDLEDDHIVEKGQIILNQMQDIANQVIESTCMVKTINGNSFSEKIAIVNAPFPVYQLVLETLNKTYPMALSFYQTKDGRWKVSIRTTDASRISAIDFAQANGGGGHKNAAGFTTNSLDTIFS